MHSYPGELKSSQEGYCTGQLKSEARRAWWLQRWLFVPTTAVHHSRAGVLRMMPLGAWVPSDIFLSTGFRKWAQPGPDFWLDIWLPVQIFKSAALAATAKLQKGLHRVMEVSSSSHLVTGTASSCGSRFLAVRVNCVNISKIATGSQTLGTLVLEWSCPKWRQFYIESCFLL